VATTKVENVDGGPPRVLFGCPAATTTEVPLGGADGISGSGHHLRAGLKGLLKAGLATATTEVEDVDGGPLGVLMVSPTVATTDVEDVDGGPPGGCWW
jgi:hypothetical protein